MIDQKKLKDTKIEWIGQVPSHWSLKKIKYVFWERKENNDPIQTDNLISLTIEKGVIPHSEKTGGGNKPKEDLSKYKIVRPGDIVLNSMNIIAGAVGISKYYGVVSPVYYMLIPLDESSSKEYFHHLFRTEPFQKSLYGLGNGILIKENEETGKLNTIRMRIPMDKLGGQYIPLPPQSEQKLISTYLNKKTIQLNSLVEKIQTRIELLKEHRNSFINQCVTKGLNRNVEMKDSGVDWIGEIPKHWEISPMFTLFDENKLKNKDGRLDVLTLTYGKIKYRDITKMEGLVPETFDGYQVMNIDSIIIRSTDLQNDHKSLRVGHVGIAGVITSAYLGLVPKNSSSTKFYYYSIHLADLKKVLYGLGGGLRQSLRFDDFKRFPIINPPENERDLIADRLDNFNRSIDELISKLERRISLLNEYRQSLISSVVMGKHTVTEEMI